MFGLKTIEDAVTNLFGRKETKNNETLTRGFLDSLSYGGGETSFLQPQMNIQGYNGIIGVSDYTINSKDVFQMCSQDSYFSSLVKTAEEQIFVKGGYFDAQKRRLPELKEIYKKYDIEGLLRKIFKYEFAEGGGNWILYPNNGKLVVDPFWAEGSHRANVYGDDDNREVVKVDILSYGCGQAIRSITTNQNNRFIKIGRYEDGGSYMFSSNPAKRAVFWWIIKKYIGGANLMAFKNGLQDPIIVDPAYDKLAAMAQAFTQGKVSSDGEANVTKKFLQDPLKTFASNADLTIEMLRQAQGVKNTNKVLYAKTPINITKIGRDNKSMETIALRDVCNQEISFACGIGRGVLDAENAKFNNAEQMKDNLMSFVVKPYQRKLEQLINEVILPFYSPEFEAKGEKYIFGKEIGEEDIEIYKAKTERVNIQADIITKIVGTGYELNLETMELEKLSDLKPTENISLENTEIKNNEKLVENKTKDKTEIQEQRSQKSDEKKTLIESVLETAKFQKFNSSVEKIFAKQLTNYSEKLIKYENPQAALDSFDKDFKPISNFGFGVQQAKTQLLMFGKLGVESVENELGKNKRANTDNFDFPMEVLEVIDIQSQILVKGWESLGTNQLEIAKQFFPQLEKTADGSPYKGLDNQTGQQVLSILKDGLEKGIGTKEIAKNLSEKISEISKSRATLITETETSKAFQTARFLEYKSEGAKWKKWSTVRDKNVRDPHTQNMNQGWIIFDQNFISGEITSGTAPRCRCDVSISLSETKPE